MEYNEFVTSLDDMLNKRFFSKWHAKTETAKKHKVYFIKYWKDGDEDARFNWAIDDKPVPRQTFSNIELYCLGTIENIYDLPGSIGNIVKSMLIEDIDYVPNPMFEGSLKDDTLNDYYTFDLNGEENE